MRLHIALDLGIAAFVLMFLAESPENLGGRMPLFRRSRLVVFENLLDHRQKRSEKRSFPDPLLWQRVRLCLIEYFPNCVARVIKFTGDLANGFAVPPGPSNGTVIVHRKHPCPP
jgi:hypothetical protein